MDRSKLRSEIRKGGMVGDSKPLRTKHLDTLGVRLTREDTPHSLIFISCFFFCTFQVLSDFSKENNKMEAHIRMLEDRVHELETNAAAAGTPEFVTELQDTITIVIRDKDKLQRQLDDEKGTSSGLKALNAKLIQENREFQSNERTSANSSCKDREALELSAEAQKTTIQNLTNEKKDLIERLKELSTFIDVHKATESSHLAQINELQKQVEVAVRTTNKIAVF